MNHKTNYLKNAKQEIASIKFHSRHEKMAFLSALIRTSGSLIISGGELKLILATENASIKELIDGITKDVYKAESAEKGVVRQELEFKGAYLVKLLADCEILTAESGEQKVLDAIAEQLIKSDSGAVAYIRGAFLGSGSVTVSEKYHLEFVFSSGSIANEFCNLLKRFNLPPKTIVRKDRIVVYFKDSQLISDCLALLGAGRTVLELNNLIAERAVKSYSNRFTNCEVYNIGRQVDASVKQVQIINELMAKGVISDGKLLETAKIRLKYPDSSYEQLSEILGISKSGVKHRLLKLTDIYNDGKF